MCELKGRLAKIVCTRFPYLLAEIFFWVPKRSVRRSQASTTLPAAVLVLVFGKVSKKERKRDGLKAMHELSLIIICMLAGLFAAYNTDYRDKMEQSLRECAKDCINKDECVVLTGHSQGGAIAAVAAVYLADLNPLVFTFGQPPTIDLPCPVITSERWYRFINTKSVEQGVIGITYDPIPFAPSMGIDSWGHMIILSDDKSHVAYIGLDAQDTFGPLNVKGFEAHSMIHANGTTFPGYLDRIETIMKAYENRTYPIVSTGFVATSLCVS